MRPWTKRWERALRLIDANVFIYAAGDEHPYKRPCLQVLELVRQGTLEANTDMEVLQEILHFYQKRGVVDFGAEVLKNALVVFPDPLHITVPIMVAASDTLVRHPGLQARDALHTAVVLHESLEGIVSADQGFDAIPEITCFDPKDL